MTLAGILGLQDDARLFGLGEAREGLSFYRGRLAVS
jgi:hypothetical protein